MTHRQYYPWMTDDHWRCAELIADVFGGFHHLNTFKQNGTGVRVVLHERDLATFDFAHLTHLVILAHDRCIRVSVVNAGTKLALQAFARIREGDAMERHPTLEQAIAKFRREPAKV